MIFCTEWLIWVGRSRLLARIAITRPKHESIVFAGVGFPHRPDTSLRGLGIAWGRDTRRQQSNIRLLLGRREIILKSWNDTLEANLRRYLEHENVLPQKEAS